MNTKREYTSALDVEAMKKVREEMKRDLDKHMDEAYREVEARRAIKYNILPDWL